MITSQTLVNFLKLQQVHASFTDKLKIVDRRYICPFDDLLSMVKPTDNICDIGCGSGQFCLLVSEFTHPASIYGIEIYQKLIDHASELLSAYKTQKYYFETYNGIDFPDKVAEADLIFLIDVLHHVPPKNQERFLKNLAGKIKPGARLIIKDIDGANPFVIFNKLHDIIFARQRGKELSIDKVISLLEQDGLQVITKQKRRMYVYPHYTIIAKK